VGPLALSQRFPGNKDLGVSAALDSTACFPVIRSGGRLVIVPFCRGIFGVPPFRETPFPDCLFYGISEWGCYTWSLPLQNKTKKTEYFLLLFGGRLQTTCQEGAFPINESRGFLLSGYLAIFYSFMTCACSISLS